MRFFFFCFFFSVTPCFTLLPAHSHWQPPSNTSLALVTELVATCLHKGHIDSCYVSKSGIFSYVLVLDPSLDFFFFIIIILLCILQ